MNAPTFFVSSLILFLSLNTDSRAGAPQAQTDMSELFSENNIVSGREQHGLRGPVKTCMETSVIPAWVDAEGTGHPETIYEYTTQFGPDGRLLLTRSGSGDSEWMTQYTYVPSSDRLLSERSGKKGEAAKETKYSYDDNGRLLTVARTGASDDAVVFHYGEHGIKTKVVTSRAEDYRENVAEGGSPLSIADRPPNLRGGGTATTIYDEHGRPVEVQVRDAQGEVVKRAVAVYDSQGRLLEEKQILDSPELMFPPEIRERMREESGLSDEQVRAELRAKLAEFMGGQSGMYSMSYKYDKQGRVIQAHRRIFNRDETIETTYNEQGDKVSEITRGNLTTRQEEASHPGARSYEEVRYSYQYDEHGNWIEQTVSSRSSPEGTFTSSVPATKRVLTYY
jgi:hypothetical protein